MRLVKEWWGYSPVEIEVPVSTGSSPSADGVGLFFSGGGDSFYSLFTGMERITHLITLIGYDVKLSDTARVAELVETTRAVASATGKIPIFVQSNLRSCREFARVPWEHTHGAMLAAVGHLLAPIVGEVRITAGYPLDDLKAWGTHAQLDPLWSSSSLRVVHTGAELSRTLRLQSVADEPLFQKYLRVCW